MSDSPSSGSTGLLPRILLPGSRPPLPGLDRSGLTAFMSTDKESIKLRSNKVLIK
jgi:hypothetical protein